MGSVTNIAWTDSTWNPWIGCQKVGPGCDHCYAEGVNKRTGGANWGPGATRRPTSAHNLNEPSRWNSKAKKFFEEHGRRQRVFVASMGDIMDNAVDIGMAHQAFAIMERNTELDWQPLTKRVGIVEKRVPPHWLNGGWPRHVGLMITVVNQEEADRDIPKLLDLKKRLNIPWVGLSYEPALGAITFRWAKWHPVVNSGHLDGLEAIDWIIFGGESGAGWRPCEMAWARKVRDQCAEVGTAFFMKQVSAFNPKHEAIPEDLNIRQFPRAA